MSPPSAHQLIDWVIELNFCSSVLVLFFSNSASRFAPKPPPEREKPAAILRLKIFWEIVDPATASKSSVENSLPPRWTWGSNNLPILQVSWVSWNAERIGVPYFSWNFSSRSMVGFLRRSSISPAHSVLSSIWSLSKWNWTRGYWSDQGWWAKLYQAPLCKKAHLHCSWHACASCQSQKL